MEVIPSNPLGAYGEVYICYQKQTGCSRAVKILLKTELSEMEKANYIKEIETMKTLDHPNIARLYETYDDSKRYYLITE